MQWTKPDFQDIPLGMEVTAYANTDDSQIPEVNSGPPEKSAPSTAVPCATVT